MNNFDAKIVQEIACESADFEGFSCYADTLPTPWWLILSILALGGLLLALDFVNEKLRGS
jgi:hypothetical protein